MSPYQRPFPNTWWLRRRPYFLFMVREITSVFVAAYCVLLLVVLTRLHQGPEAYASIIDSLRSPISVILHCIVLVFALYHTVTWFNLTPKIMVLQLGEQQVSPLLIAGSIYASWIAVSALVAWVVLVR